MTSQLDNLERLERLRADGALSEGEFLREKARLLSEPVQSGGRPRWKAILAILVLFLVAMAFMTALLWRAPAGEPATANVAATGNETEMPTPAPSPTPSPLVSTAPESSNDSDYTEAVREAEQDYANVPPAIRSVLAQEIGADVMCRGGPDIAKWCPIRDRLSDKLTTMGMCYGRPTDQNAADSDWHKCDDRDQVAAPENAD